MIWMWKSRYLWVSWSANDYGFRTGRRLRGLFVASIGQRITYKELIA